MLLPSLAEISMGRAALFMPLVGVFGADVSAAEDQVAAARRDGKVYAVVPVRMVATTQPVVGVSVNGGSAATLLVDTGASGLVTTRDKVGSADLGPMTGQGDSCFSGGICYHYETYNTTVDLGGGAVTTAPVNIVTDSDEYPDSVAVFWGLLLLGRRRHPRRGRQHRWPRPGPDPDSADARRTQRRLAALPERLAVRFGRLHGPRPQPAAHPGLGAGAPDAYVKVSVDGGAQTDAGAIIDSGGVYGTLNTANDPTGTTVGQNLPAAPRSRCTPPTVRRCYTPTPLATAPTAPGDRQRSDEHRQRTVRAEPDLPQLRVRPLRHRFDRLLNLVNRRTVLSGKLETCPKKKLRRVNVR